MQVLVQQRNFLAVVAGQNYSNDIARAREISKGSTLTFGALQKNTFGFDNALASCMKLFENRRLALPDAVVIPHGSFGVLKMCKPESRTYAICGDLAQRLDISPTRDFVSNVYDNKFQIFEHRPMNISQDSNEINMLTRERDVGNVFRIFRDNVNYGGSSKDTMHTAIQIVDHDKQRWRTITLTEALDHSDAFDSDGYLKDMEIFSDDTTNAYDASNKKTCYRFGDINEKYLLPIMSEVVRSIRAHDAANPGKPMNDIAAGRAAATGVEEIPEAAWYSTGDTAPETSAAPIGGAVGMLSATVEDVADAIIGSAVSGGPISGDSDVVKTASELASVTTGSMPGALRGAIVETIGSSGPSLFKNSRKVVKTIGRNTNSSKAAELKAKLLDAMQADFRAGWSDLSKASREALRQNEIEFEAAQAASAAAVIGAQSAVATKAAASTTTKFTPYRGGAIDWWYETPITKAAIRALDELGIVTPFGAYVFRPFQSFEMGSMIVMKSGTDTGMTVVGNSDFQLGGEYFKFFRIFVFLCFVFNI